jgi:Asp-tRNA(Asn)/Glu-tRNA(Gln) amidotransferase C subunit
MTSLDTQFESSQRARIESRESKESEKNEELQKAAAMERADFLVKEVQSSTKQMQSIVMHMSQVKQAIHALRQQMQLAHVSDPTSMKQDALRISMLRKKIQLYQQELGAMKGELITEQYRMLREDRPHESVDLLQKEATQLVQRLLSGAYFSSQRSSSISDMSSS